MYAFKSAAKSPLEKKKKKKSKFHFFLFSVCVQTEFSQTLENLSSVIPDSMSKLTGVPNGYWITLFNECIGPFYLSSAGVDAPTRGHQYSV